VELAVLSNHQIRAEPRLTALVTWNSATAATIFGTFVVVMYPLLCMLYFLFIFIVEWD